MKKILVLAALIVAPLAANAADLPSKKAPVVAPAVSAPVFTWTGCHVGINAGVGSLHSSYDAEVAGDLGSNTGTGAIAGGQIGCDYQINNFVFGVQGSFDAASLKGSNTIEQDGPSVETIETKADWLATATARAGILVQPQFLLYVTGGAAWMQTSFTDSNPTYSTPYTGSAKTTHTGWLIGGGAEYALNTNWSVFVEYNYIKFSGKTVDIAYSDATNDNVAMKHDLNRVMVGVNYKF
jgi:outer membrane immunogenic protein